MFYDILVLLYLGIGMFAALFFAGVAIKTSEKQNWPTRKLAAKLLFCVALIFVWAPASVMSLGMDYASGDDK